MSVYDLLKKIARTVVPKSFLFKHELKFRYFNYLAHRGTAFECNLCHAKLKSFIDNNNKTRPKCGSIARERRLWGILQSSNFLSKEMVLDFSPSRAIFRELKKLKGENYVGTDLSGNFLADKSYDITNVNCESETFDLIICYHILEHIVEDSKAMSELFRILKKDGVSFIQTPFKEGEIYEDFKITSPNERLKAFGQDDHVRIYSLESLKNRLENAGFNIEILSFKEDSKNRSGFNFEEQVLI